MEKVIIESEIKVDQPVSVTKNLKSQIKEARLEQQQLADQFGETSKQATAAATKVNELMEKQEDLNRATKAYASDPFDRVEFALRGVSAGFQAATGAAAVFGSESEDVQKALLKVQGAMALTQGIKDILDLGKAYNLFSKETLVNVVKSLGTVRGALIATGVGAAAVALGLLIANWDAVVKIVREFIGLGPTATEIIEEQTKAYEEQADAIERASELQDAYIQQLTGRDKEAAELTKGFSDRLVAAEMDRQKRLLDLDKAFKVDGLINEEEYARKKAKINEDYQKLAQAINGGAEVAQREQIKKFRKEDTDAAKAKREKDEAARKKEIEDWLAERFHVATIQQKFLESQEKMQENAEDTALKKAEAHAEEIIGTDDVVTDKKLQNKAKQMLAEQAAFANAEMIAGQFAGLAGAISDLLGRQTQAGKTAALLQIGFDTAKALTAALFVSQSPTPDNVATGGLAGIAKYVAIAGTIFSSAAKARQVLNSGASGSASASSASVPALSFQAPQIPRGSTVEGSGDIELSQRVPTTQRVYVVESDITRTQNKVRVTEENATIK